MPSDYISASRLKRGNTNPRYENILLKNFLTEDFNFKSSQFFKNIENLIGRKKKKFFKF
jgi:hypothetical protein